MPRRTSQYKRVATYLTQHQIDRLKREARSKGISYAELLRRIIDAYYAAERRDKDS